MHRARQNLQRALEAELASALDGHVPVRRSPVRPGRRCRRVAPGRGGTPCTDREAFGQRPLQSIDAVRPLAHPGHLRPVRQRPWRPAADGANRHLGSPASARPPANAQRRCAKSARTHLEKVFGTCKRSYGPRRMGWLGWPAGSQVRLESEIS